MATNSPWPKVRSMAARAWVCVVPLRNTMLTPDTSMACPACSIIRRSDPFPPPYLGMKSLV